MKLVHNETGTMGLGLVHNEAGTMNWYTMRLGHNVTSTE